MNTETIPQHGTLQRSDGKWLAIRHGLPLVDPNTFLNRIFDTEEAADKALARVVPYTD